MPGMTKEIKARLDELTLVGRVIPRGDLSREVELIVQKWPAYRFMGPMEATRLFLTDYEAAYKAQHSVNGDKDEADGLKIGRKTMFHRNNDRLTQLWRARQFADSLGVPYPEYLEFSMDFASRRNLRKYLPQPNQLGPTDRNREAWWDGFQKFWDLDRKKLAFDRMTPMSQYTVFNRRGLPAQTEFLHELLNIGAGTSANIQAFYENYVERKMYLDFTECLGSAFRGVPNPTGLANDHRVWGWPGSETYKPLRSHDLLQSCFGVPGTEHTGHMICMSCRLKTSCDSFREAALAMVETLTGESDPISAKKRASQRERTRRCRALKKLREAS